MCSIFKCYLASCVASPPLSVSLLIPPFLALSLPGPPSRPPTSCLLCPLDLEVVWQESGRGRENEKEGGRQVEGASVYLPLKIPE